MSEYIDWGQVVVLVTTISIAAYSVLFVLILNLP